MLGSVLSRIVPVVLTPALPAGVDFIEFEDLSGQPGATVEVSVLASFDHPALAFAQYFTFDPDRLEFLGYDVAGSAAQNAEPLNILFNTLESGVGVFGIHRSRETVQSFSIPPGERQHLGTIRFRIRAAAEVGVTALVPTRGLASAFTLDVNGEPSSMAPESFLEASVTVLAPSGPRPVGDLHCVQFLARVRISFTLTENYDEIEVLRDNSTIATLPGWTTEFVDPLEGLGTIGYSLVARRGTESSPAADCEVLAVSPAAPAVSDLECSGSTLTWSNPVAYDRISVLRSGEQIAVLPGSAQGFTDPDAPDEPTVYTVVAELEDFRSPDTSCMANGVWVMEIGDVQVPVDAERVVVPIYATTSRTTFGMEFHVGIDLDRFELVEDFEVAFDGTVSDPSAEFLQMGIGIFGVPAAGVVFDFNPPIQPEKNLAVGLRQRVFNFTFTPRGTFSEGDTFPVGLHPQSGFDLGGVRQNTDTYIGGQIRFGSSGVAPVRRLQAVVEEGGGGGAGDPRVSRVRLSWQSGDEYERIRIERNGTLVADIPGDATEYRDPDVDQGVFTYKVTGVRADTTSFPASAFLSTVSSPGTFLRGDANRDGVIDIADPIATLNFLFLDGPPLPCEDAADAEDNGVINISDPILTLTHLFRGGVVIKSPGTTYAWYDPTPDGLTCLN